MSLVGTIQLVQARKNGRSNNDDDSLLLISSYIILNCLNARYFRWKENIFLISLAYMYIFGVL